MSKVTSLISKIAIAGVSFFSMASSALAYEYTAGEYEMTEDQAEAFFALFTGPFLIVSICGVLLGCLLIVFNIWMLVDVIKRTETELPNKTMWMILLIIGLLIGFGGIVALVYYFSARKKLAK